MCMGAHVLRPKVVVRRLPALNIKKKYTYWFCVWLGEESEYDSVCGWERKMRRVPGITLGLSGLAASAFAFFVILPASLHPVFSNTVFFFFLNLEYTNMIWLDWQPTHPRYFSPSLSSAGITGEYHHIQIFYLGTRIPHAYTSILWTEPCLKTSHIALKSISD